MTRMRKLACFVLSSSFVSLMLCSNAVRAQDKVETEPAAATSSDTDAAVILIVDASGSMKGRMKGKTKWNIAKDTIGQVVGDLPPEREIGMMAYGHRGGKCNDIQLLVPPAAGAGQGIVDAVNAMRPRGETPLTETVRRAAKELKFQEKPATVVLVTDGIESCKGDPCALGEELEAEGVEFTAHVVGFGLSEKDGAAVACLAKNTGGLYIAANDADQLSEALKQTVMEAPVDAEPEPATPKAPLFSVDFKNGFDASQWEILRENKGKWGHVDGRLTIAGTNKSGWDDPKAENIFLAKTDIPQGDFDLVADFTASMSSRNALVSIGVYMNETEYVEAALFRSSAPGKMEVAVTRVTGGQRTASAKGVPTVAKTAEYQPANDEAGHAHVDKVGGRLTLSKRGASAFAQFEYLDPPADGDYKDAVKTDNVSLFQAQGRFALGGSFWNPCYDWCGETIIRFNKVEVRQP